MDFAFLIAGVAGLWLGTELTVGSALAIARRHQLSEFFVGLVILSIGSDLPELAIAIDAGIKSLMGQDASGVVVGTSIGSVIAQIGFVLGLGGMISYLTLPRHYIYRHGTVLLGATLLLALVALDGIVTRIEGLVLIGSYVIYIFALMNGENVPEEEPEPVARGGFRSWLMLATGLAVVVFSSEATVRSVVNLARAFDISEALIAVLVIGIGSSLPELSISISAILKKKTHMSVGNIIGSNILDTLLPIGIAAVITPVLFEPHLLYFDIPFIFILTSTVLYFFLRKRGIKKTEGAIILGLYFAYVIFKLSQF